MSFLGSGVFGLAAQALNLLSLLILLDVLLSWAWMLGWRAAAPYVPWVRALRRVTDPILRPLRALIPPRMMQGLDISPILAILILRALGDALTAAARGI